MPTKHSESLVLVSNSNGLVIIPTKTPLTRLNYFDGKFLRASDLKGEQDYLRQLVRQSNQAGGSGVVHGFDLTLGGGDTLDLGPGLGINPDGRVLLLPQGLSVAVQELIERSQDVQEFHKQGDMVSAGAFEQCEITSEAPPVNTTHGNDLYLIVISPAEALCGEEDVFGKLCEEACATSTDRPFAVEGLIVRAVPLVLQTALPHSQVVPIATKAHLRSRVAAAYFEDERRRVASMISRFGLSQQTWCLGADAANGGGLPIGVIARAGATTVFLDAWIARRERMDTPPRRYWQWRMMMRPWDVFLAQILQFQCQLRDLVGGIPIPGGEDPCGDARTVIGEAAKKIADLVKVYRESKQQDFVRQDVITNLEGEVDAAFRARIVELEGVSQKLASTEQQMTLATQDQMLIRGGIVELPSAGYLPVAPDANVPINKQVRRLMGEGVDLRFCVVRPDYVAHALEEAQHLERISLIEGLEDPKKKPQVDILVPDGEIIAAAQPDTRLGFAADVQMQSKITFGGEPSPRQTLPLPTVPFNGAARSETLPTGGTAVYLSCSSPSRFTPLGSGLELNAWKGLAGSGTGFDFEPGDPPRLGLWVSLRSNRNLLLLRPGDVTGISAQVVIAAGSQGKRGLEFRGQIEGLLTVATPRPNMPVFGNVAASFSFEGLGFPRQSGNLQFELAANQPGPGRIDINLNVTNNTRIDLKTDLSNPANIEAELRFTHIPNARTVFEINLQTSLTKDEDIFAPTNSNHILALQALQFIAGALNDSDFVTEKTILLFPPGPTSQSGGGLVRAKRDWVLFHRRRAKQCAAEPVAAATRRYRVYQVAPSAFGTQGLEFDIPNEPPTREEILSLPAGIWQLFAPIGFVTFGGGVATFVGDNSSLKSAWRHIPGGAILWGAIASRGDAVSDGNSLALARLAALESDLDQVSPSARADVLPIVPPALESTDNDGIIIVVNGRRSYQTYTAGGPESASPGIGGTII